jgi:hypothetical protein
MNQKLQKFAKKLQRNLGVKVSALIRMHGKNQNYSPHTQ